MATGTVKKLRRVLWENSDAETSFAAQTVNLASNTCSEFEIAFSFANNRPENVGSVKLKPGEGAMFAIPATTNMDVGAFSGLLVRRCSSTQSSVTFSDAHAVDISTGNSTNNIFMIPLRVVGIG